MPTLTKAYTLTVTAEQFLEACSLTELQEVDLLLNKYIDKKRFSDHLSNSRCCGRCDGVEDICVADQTCDEHDKLGCEECFGKRSLQHSHDVNDDSFESYKKPVRKTFAERLEEAMNKKLKPKP